MTEITREHVIEAVHNALKEADKMRKPNPAASGDWSAAEHIVDKLEEANLLVFEKVVKIDRSFPAFLKRPGRARAKVSAAKAVFLGGSGEGT